MNMKRLVLVAPLLGLAALGTASAHAGSVCEATTAVTDAVTQVATDVTVEDGLDCTAVG